MKTLITFLSILSLLTSQAQTIYDLTPGSRGNEIRLTIANVSENDIINDVNVELIKESFNIIFHNANASLALIEPKKEEIITFTFDVNRNAPLNKKDTVDFKIASNNSTSLQKSFIFNYTPPKEFKLEQNFPNPFNPATTIQYQLPADSRVTLKVYDILGSEVATLVNEEQQAGYKEIKFNAMNFSSGMYVYRLQAGDFVSTKKMMLLK